MNEIRFWRGVLALLAVGLAVVFVAKVWSVLLPFSLGIVVAYLISPLVDRFVALGLRRDRTVIVLYVLLLGTTVSAAIVLLPLLHRESRLLAEDLPTYAASFDNVIDRLNNEIRAMLRHLVGSKAASFAIPFRAERFFEGMVENLPHNLLNFAQISLWILIVPFVSFFALSQGREWLDTIFDFTPSRYVESLLGFMAEVDAALGGYVRGQLLDSLCVGGLTMVGLFLIGFNGAALVGVITGLLNVVPLLAPVVGGSLALIAGYAQGLVPSQLLAVALLFGGIRLLDDFFLTPFIVGSSVRLHPVLMVFAILAGFELGGFLGLVFAVPIAAVAKVTLETALSRRRSMVLDHRHVI